RTRFVLRETSSKTRFTALTAVIPVVSRKFPQSGFVATVPTGCYARRFWGVSQGPASAPAERESCASTWMKRAWHVTQARNRNRWLCKFVQHVKASQGYFFLTVFEEEIWVRTHSLLRVF